MRRLIDTPAKINLFLQVTGRRADGYHDLCTVFWPLPRLCDRIEVDFDAAPGLRVMSDDPALPCNADNLAGRAALEFAKAAQLDPGWDITITKRIPVAAGLGGGSSDAAAVLRLLNSRYQALDNRTLRSVALSLGADVPYFLNPSPALARGVGEELEYLSGELTLPPVLIIAPGFPVSAKWTYTHLSPENIGEHTACHLALLEALRSGSAAAASGSVYNALGIALFDKFPLLRLLRESALENGALKVEVSGSGPTLFAVAPDESALDRIQTALEKDFKGIRYFRQIQE